MPPRHPEPFFQRESESLLRKVLPRYHFGSFYKTKLMQ